MSAAGVLAMDAQPTPPAQRFRALWWALGLLLGVAALWGLVKFLLSAPDEAPRRVATKITVLRPPPPPPPPPKQEKPPEPPKLKDEVKIDPPKPVDTPKPQADEAPPPGPLGVDAQGTGPGDGFGLAGRPGGRDIVLGGGGNPLANATFANGVARHIAQELARDARLRASEYRIVVNVWIGRDGRIERHEVVRGSGDAEMDRLIADGLARLAPVKQPPEGLPQPMRIRVTSADA
jgi:protein TonB